MFLLLLLRITGVALKGTGGNELTQLVANHVLGHVHRHMLAAVVDGKGVTNEFGEEDVYKRQPYITSAFTPAFSIFSLAEAE